MKTLKEIMERLAALDIEVRDATEMEVVETLGKEKTELLERKKSLKQSKKEKRQSKR